MSAALLKSSVRTYNKAKMVGFGMVTADWHPDVRMCSGVKSGCILQNSAVVVWGGGAVGV